MPFDWSPLLLSLRYAGLATLISILAGLPLAYALARRRFPGRDLLDAAASFPLVLPAAVLVYYLLAAFGRLPIPFHWRAAVGLSAFYTLPLFVRMARSGLEDVDHDFEKVARSLGAGEWRVFWRITVPTAWRTLAAALLAAFARSLGDFGLTAILAANVKDTANTGALASILLAATFVALYAGNRLRRGQVPA